MAPLLRVSGVCYDPRAEPPDGFESDSVSASSNAVSPVVISNPVPRADPHATAEEPAADDSRTASSVDSCLKSDSAASTSNNADANAAGTTTPVLISDPQKNANTSETAVKDAPSCEKKARRDSDSERAAAAAESGGEQSGYDERPPALPTVIEAVKYFEFAIIFRLRDISNFNFS